MNKIIVALVIIVLLGIGVYFINKNLSSDVVIENEDTITATTTPVATTTNTEANEATDEVVDPSRTVIGSSVEERDITAYHYGTGDTELLFVGGIHGGYEWNTVLVAYELMDYLDANPNLVPPGVRVTVIPVLNPDGLNKTVGTTDRFTRADVPTGEDATVPGRFNANNVDLNRNFDCDWQAMGRWQNTDVSGGSRAFSEPESQAIQKYVTDTSPDAVVVWYSAAGGVFASNCHEEVLPETRTLTNLYAQASGYRAYESFDFYAITGDMVNWLAKENIPAISVLLTTHEDTEWTKNKAGIDALLKHYAE